MMEEILRKEIAGFRPLLAGGLPVHDDSVIALVCDGGHVHKYYISDIASDRVIACDTCTFGPKSLKQTHTLVEAILKMPMSLDGARKDAAFVNHRARLRVRLQKSGSPSAARGDYLEITLVATQSKQKVVDLLYRYLAGWPGVGREVMGRLCCAARCTDCADFAADPLPYNTDYAAHVPGAYAVSDSLCFEKYAMQSI